MKILVLVVGLAGLAAAQEDPLEATIRPFVEKNCQQCHNSTLAQANIDLQGMVASADSFSAEKLYWDQVISALRTGEMPPGDKPAAGDIDAMVAAVRREFVMHPVILKEPRKKVDLGPATHDWTTYSYDPERTGWARGETALTKSTAGGLTLLWKTQLDAVPNVVNVHATLTDPLVLGDRVIVAGGANERNALYALDTKTGKIVWERSYPNNEKPPSPPNGACPNNLNATPVIDPSTGTVYVLPTDGKMRGVGVSDGEERLPPTQVVPAFSRNFSLNFAFGNVYATTTRGCAGATSEVVEMDAKGAGHAVEHFYTSPGKGSGVWGRGGIVESPWGVIAQTADGAYDPASGRWGNSILEFTPELRLMDSFTPANETYINAKDFDLGSGSPVVFDYGDQTLVAAAAKEGVIYLLDAANLGGKDHRTALYVSPRYSNDAGKFGYNGMWGAMGTYVDASGARWLLVPMMGPPAKATVGDFKTRHGDVVNGSLMAFKVETRDGKPVLTPQWMSGDLDLPGVPVVANGVVYVLADGDRGATLVRRQMSGGRGGRGGGPGGRGGRGRGPMTLPLTEVNPEMPGYERDAEWRAIQLRAPDEGGQAPGQRYSGGRDTTHAVLYALDGETGDEIYSSGEAIDSWNHYGGIALANGQIYVTTYDARVYAFGLKK